MDPDTHPEREVAAERRILESVLEGEGISNAGSLQIVSKQMILNPLDRLRLLELLNRVVVPMPSNVLGTRGSGFRGKGH